MATNTLAGIELPTGTRWIDQHEWTPMDLSMTRTVSGHVGFSAQTLIGGRPITLEFKPTDWPLLDIGKVNQLKSVCSKPNMLLFDWWGTEYIVLPKAHSFQQMLNRYNQATDYFIGTLNLITVS